MKRFLATLSTLTILSVSHTSVFAAEEANIDSIKLQEIEAVCDEQARGASSPEEYFAQCVEDKIQALKPEIQPSDPDQPS